ncbi:MAG: hypothetical protein N2515_07605 [Deltaproteobacteria bacterium]|nr:hypothetical protein [Deltaproteobacteria bacterium]
MALLVAGAGFTFPDRRSASARNTTQARLARGCQITGSSLCTQPAALAQAHKAPSALLRGTAGFPLLLAPFAHSLFTKAAPFIAEDALTGLANPRLFKKERLAESQVNGQ